MKASEYRRLLSLARRHDIEPTYIDVAGNPRHASPETLRAILAAQGVSASNEKDIRVALSNAAAAAQAQVLEPVTVLWQNQPLAVPLRPQESWPARKLPCRLALEDGSTKTWSIDLAQLPTLNPRRSHQRGVLTKLLPLPEMPLGYHRLTLQTRSGPVQSMLIAAPAKSYSAPAARSWGIFLPMYACHSQRSWGAGDVTDWRRFCHWTSQLGGSVAGTLPLLPAFLDEPFEPSPYSPVSRLFWNEFYIDVTSVPEFAACAAAQKLVASTHFQNKLKALRESSLVDYREQMTLKSRVLQLLSDFFFSKDSPRRREFEAFLRLNPEVRKYAQFRAVSAQQKTGWPNWPARLQKGNFRPADCSETRQKYFLYIQWLAHAQIGQVLADCKSNGVRFCLDLPLGVNPAGYDAWRYPQLFVNTLSVGAPPDTFFTQGQNWGFAPLDPRQMRQECYSYVLQAFRFHMRHTGLLRIDHVMGLHRLYCVPKSMPASNGAYIRYRAAELYALLCLESLRHHTVLVGENLGTVPPAVNARLQRHAVRKMYVFQYELKPARFAPLGSVPRQSVASLNTHDMPTFAAFVNGLDIADRVKLGLINPAERRHETQNRRELVSNLAAFLRRKKFLDRGKTAPRDLLKAALSWLGASDAELVLVNLEDLWHETHPQNVPGTTTERPNWRRKSRFNLEQFPAQKELIEALENLSQARPRLPDAKIAKPKFKASK